MSEVSFGESSSKPVFAHHCCCSMYPTKDTPTLRHLYDSVVAKLPHAKIPPRNTFLDWHRFGCKFASLVEGGTVYLLLIIAGLDLRWSIAKAYGKVIKEMAGLLRAPDDTGKHSLSAWISTERL